MLLTLTLNFLPACPKNSAAGPTEVQAKKFKDYPKKICYTFPLITFLYCKTFWKQLLWQFTDSCLLFWQGSDCCCNLPGTGRRRWYWSWGYYKRRWNWSWSYYRCGGPQSRIGHLSWLLLCRGNLLLQAQNLPRRSESVSTTKMLSYPVFSNYSM